MLVMSNPIFLQMDLQQFTCSYGLDSITPSTSPPHSITKHKRNTHREKVATEFQGADFLTKGQNRIVFQCNRKQVLGWQTTFTTKNDLHRDSLSRHALFTYSTKKPQSKVSEKAISTFQHMNDRKKQKEKIMIIEMSFTFMRWSQPSQRSLVPSQSQLSGVVTSPLSPYNTVVILLNRGATCFGGIRPKTTFTLPLTSICTITTSSRVTSYTNTRY